MRNVGEPHPHPEKAELAPVPSASRAAPPPLPVVGIGSLLFVLVTTAGLAIIEFWHYYAKVTELHLLELGLWDKVLVYWSCWSMALLLTAPGLLLGGLCLWRGHRRWAIAVVAIGAILPFAWLTIDMRVQRLTGHHLWYYAREILEPRAYEWAGDVSHLVLVVCRDLGIAMALTLGSLFVCHGLLRRLYRGFPHLRYRRVWGVAAGVFLAASLGIVPVRLTVKKGLALEYLYGAMPTQLWLFSPDLVPEGTNLAFGVACNDVFTAPYERVFARVTSPEPVDEHVRLDLKSRPNVVVVFVESFRREMLCREHMPKFEAWSRRGLRLDRHYAVSNTSGLGAYALLYSRSPLAYDVTLDAGVAPQSCETFGRAGYRRTLVGCEDFPFRGMNRFLNDRYFDRVIIHSKDDWPTRDRKIVADVIRTVREAKGTPQFVVAYLLSTHYPYMYPPEYATHVPAAPDIQSRRDLWNRYQNAASFMDDILGQCFSSLDPERNIIVVTGDHGESLLDDGTVGHSSRLSEVQTMVPMAMVGPGLPQRTITRQTTHLDVLPTLLHALTGQPVPIAHCHGRDLFRLDGEPDEVLLIHEDPRYWKATLVRPGGRLGLYLRRLDPFVRVMGFCNRIGQVDPALGRSADEIPIWADSLGRIITRWAR